MTQSEPTLEIEVKFTVADRSALERRLLERQAPADAPRQDEDHYFNAPDRDFAQTDEAFRMRRIGQANFVTYKGPKLDRETKTRTEIEVPLAEGDAAATDFARLLTQLGYRPVAIVRKQRQVYHLSEDGFAVEVCLDEVDGLGSFAELEIIAPHAQLDAAKAVLARLTTEFGLGPSERRSYLQLLLEKRAGS
jgi:adenylate cyclase class 2